MNEFGRILKLNNPLDRIIDDLLAEDLERFREEVDIALRPQAEYLTSIERELYARGKKIRPIVMFLSARMMHGGGPLPKKVIQGAASLEILHVATLIHDDIVDEASVRRGLPTVCSTRGTKKALLIGDLQFVQALRGFVEAIEIDADMALVKLVLDTAFDVCRGEFDELGFVFSHNEVEMREKYFKTITRKTAVLFGLACEAGVTLAGGRTHQARRAGFFGRSMGEAFQIIDDVLDIVQLGEVAGKTPGTDLLQSRFSLPLIYALSEFGEDHMISRALVHKESLKVSDIQPCLSDLKRSKALDRAYSDARDSALSSLFYLKPFSPSVYRDALEELSMHVIDRQI